MAKKPIKEDVGAGQREPSSRKRPKPIPGDEAGNAANSAGGLPPRKFEDEVRPELEADRVRQTPSDAEYHFPLPDGREQPDRDASQYSEDGGEFGKG